MKTLTLLVHVAYFGVSVIHRTLTLTAGSLTRVWDLFDCGYTKDLGLIRRAFAVCIEFDSWEIWWRVQSLARKGHPSTWWPRLSGNLIWLLKETALALRRGLSSPKLKGSQFHNFIMHVKSRTLQCKSVSFSSSFFFSFFLFLCLSLSSSSSPVSRENPMRLTLKSKNYLLLHYLLPPFFLQKQKQHQEGRGKKKRPPLKADT